MTEVNYFVKNVLQLGMGFETQVHTWLQQYLIIASRGDSNDCTSARAESNRSIRAVSLVGSVV